VAIARARGGTASKAPLRAGHYDVAYDNFTTKLYAEIRAEAFDRNIDRGRRAKP
jgi:hypothetical protein